MKKRNGKTIIVIILICLTFISGMLFQKHCLDTKTTQKEEVESEVTEEVVPLKKENSKKEKETSPITNETVSDADEKIDEIQLEKEIQSEEVNQIDIFEEVEERRELLPIHIPQVKSLFNSSDLSIQNMPDKKQYYNGNNGMIESIVNKGEDNLFYEYLISYDYKGNKVDQLEIGITDENAQKKKYAVLFQNNVSTFEISPKVNNKNQIEEIVTNYQITPDLRFVKGKTYTKAH